MSLDRPSEVVVKLSLHQTNRHREMSAFPVSKTTNYKLWGTSCTQRDGYRMVTVPYDIIALLFSALSFTRVLNAFCVDAWSDIRELMTPPNLLYSTDAKFLPNLPDGCKFILREEVKRCLDRAKPPKSNLSGRERDALRSLQRDDSIVVLPADKGNATVVMDRTSYNSKMELLSDGIPMKSESNYWYSEEGRR